jgi:hypothetical protein
VGARRRRRPRWRELKTAFKRPISWSGVRISSGAPKILMFLRKIKRPRDEVGWCIDPTGNQLATARSEVGRLAILLVNSITNAKSCSAT